MAEFSEERSSVDEGNRTSDSKILLVPMRLWETPVPIPNTTVKTQAADGTALETVWESRWAPDQKENNRYDLKDIKLVLPVIRSFKLLFEVSND